MAPPRAAEALRAAIGAGLALILCGLLLIAAQDAVGTGGGYLLIAPLGATAFLLFAVPNSPLAQPWSAIIGNTVSAVVAVTVLKIGVPAVLAAGLAVGGAMAAMALLRALHPPGAAVALATILGASMDRVPGYDFVFAPVLLDTVALVLMAVVYNRGTGRHYPFRQHAEAGAHQTADPAPERRLGLTPGELSDVLARFNMSANIGAEDFGRVLAAAEAEAARCHFDDLTCAAVMSRDLVTVTPDARLRLVADLFQRHDFKTLPVVTGDGRLAGIITQNDLIQRARRAALGASFADSLGRVLGAARIGGLRARDIMRQDLPNVAPADGVGVLVQLLADGGVQAAPVVEADRLVGIVTRSDLIAVLARQTLLATAVRRAA